MVEKDWQQKNLTTVVLFLTRKFWLTYACHRQSNITKKLWPIFCCSSTNNIQVNSSSFFTPSCSTFLSLTYFIRFFIPFHSLGCSVSSFCSHKNVWSFGQNRSFLRGRAIAFSFSKTKKRKIVGQHVTRFSPPCLNSLFQLFLQHYPKTELGIGGYQQNSYKQHF
jgi:hypothetical protein